MSTAAQFLALLTTTGTPTVTWQTFPDCDGAPKSLATHWTATLEEAGPRLKALNDRGAGIFIMVNEGDGRGRSKANVTRIRAVFVDCDQPDADPLRLINESGIDPDFIIESSPGKYHAYRRVSDFPLDTELFAGVQLLLADRVQGDTAVKDISRVMRVPGFMHRKGEPFETRIHAVRNDIR